MMEMLQFSFALQGIPELTVDTSSKVKTTSNPVNSSVLKFLHQFIRIYMLHGPC